MLIFLKDTFFGLFVRCIALYIRTENRQKEEEIIKRFLCTSLRRRGGSVVVEGKWEGDEQSKSICGIKFMDFVSEVLSRSVVCEES